MRVNGTEVRPIENTSSLNIIFTFILYFEGIHVFEMTFHFNNTLKNISL